MKNILIIVAILAGTLLVILLAVILAIPWMARWGSIDDEIASTFLGDEFLPHPSQVVNRAITIHATTDQIYPWIVQLGADKGGMYNYTLLESLMNCHLALKALRAH